MDKERFCLTGKKKRSLGRPRSNDLKQPTSELIIEAATRLFLTDGYQKVAVDDIAETANVTKATVYYYYDSKAELFTETMVQLMGRIKGKIRSSLVAEASLYERFLMITKAHLQATVHFDLEGFMRETKNALSEGQIKRIQYAEENIFQIIEQTFIEALATNEISKKINPKFAAHTYIALLKIGNYRDSENKAIFPTAEETAEQIINFFWKGLFS